MTVEPRVKEVEREEETGFGLSSKPANKVLAS